MKTNHDQELDEMQMAVGNKIRSNSLAFIIFTILANAIISTFFNWGTPLIQAIAIIFLTSAFASTMLIFKNAYTKNDKALKKSLLLFSITSIATLAFYILFFILNRVAFLNLLVEDGVLNINAFLPFCGIFLLYESVILAIKIHNNKKIKELE